jgi:hypothetical protein
MGEKPVFYLSKESASRLTPAELANVLFGSNTRVVGNSSSFAKQNPELYQAARQAAKEGGRLAMQSTRERTIAEFGPKETRRLSTEELKARAQVSRAECDRYYKDDSQGTKDNLMQLKATDPQRYELVRAANTSYRTESDLVPKAATTADRFPVSGKLAERFGLHAGYAASPDEIADLAVLAIQIDAQAKEQADAKAAIEAAQAAK